MPSRASAAARGAAAVFLLTFLAYLPVVLHGGFVWDDDDYVTANPALDDARGLRAIWLDASATPQYYPLTHTTFWLERRLWGDDARGYHAGNVVLHGIAAALVLAIARRMRLPGAWLAAALFALHPLGVESVAWVAERKNVLSGALALGSAWCWIRAFGIARPRRDPGGRLVPAVAAEPGAGLPAAGLALFAAALLAKTAVATLPAVLVVLLLWSRQAPRARQAIYLGAMLACGAMLGSLTAELERHQIGALGAEWALSPLARLEVAGRAFWFYLGKLVWPADLSFVYPRWEVGRSAAALLWPGSVVLALAGLAAARRRIGDGPLVAAIVYGVALAPALGFFAVYPMRYAFVADHFAYLASIAPLTLAGAALARALSNVPARTARIALAAVPLAALGLATAARTRVYDGLETLWRDTLSRNPGAWMAHNNLGILDAEAGRDAEAERHFRAVLALRPDHPGVRNNLGLLLLRQGRIDEAIEVLRAGVEAAPSDLNTRLHLARALETAGDEIAAARHWAAAAALAPRDAAVRASLAVALARAGRLDAADAAFRRAVALAPRDALLRYNFGTFLARTGRFDAAERELSAALALRPGFEDARTNLERVRAALARGGGAS